MTSKATSTGTIQISESGREPVVFTTDDLDRFVLTQRDVLRAARGLEESRERERSVGERFASWIATVRDWCKSNPVAECIVAPRMDDIIVVVIAQDDDPRGELHQRMSEFDLVSFQQNELRLFWLLLRADEAAALASFVDLSAARRIYRAEP